MTVTDERRPPRTPHGGTHCEAHHREQPADNRSAARAVLHGVRVHHAHESRQREGGITWRGEQRKRQPQPAVPLRGLLDT
ncbi:hypothetical protein [Streptomyces sp. NPDC018833]|uniref:hypothetical protein n=1 Tax=Streptomyces sp. NPDC018833 TaxID=3365053 RepID=UPI0037ADE8E5